MLEQILLNKQGQGLNFAEFYLFIFVCCRICYFYAANICNAGISPMFIGKSSPQTATSQ